MDKKKGIIDTVTQSGWWKIRNDSTKSPGIADKLKKKKSNKKDQDSDTESTITRVFNRIDFFKS